MSEEIALDFVGFESLWVPTQQALAPHFAAVGLRDINPWDVAYSEIMYAVDYIVNLAVWMLQLEHEAGFEVAHFPLPALVYILSAMLGICASYLRCVENRSNDIDDVLVLRLILGLFQLWTIYAEVFEYM
jgi:hypothetical protein